MPKRHLVWLTDAQRVDGLIRDELLMPPVPGDQGDELVELPGS